MALTQKSRSEAYEGLRSIMSEESAEELLAHFPARDLDEPVTRDFVRAELAELRTELAEVDKRLTTQIAAIPNEIASRYSRQTYVILGAIGVATAFLRLS